jgi:predicted NBD/HSP70 family sugar kinase
MLWGVDLGGTKIEAAVIDPERITEPLVRRRVDTPSAEGYDAIIEAIAGLVEDCASELNTSLPKRLGMGTPGTTEPDTGLLKNSNTICLNGRPLRDDVAKRLGCELIPANDANCFALAEATLGKGRGKEVVFGVILGTGIGGGVVVKGHVLGGRHGIGGEWGHTVMDPEGVACYCGHIGCLETLIAGPSLERFYFEKSGVRRAMREIAEEDSEAARATIDRLVYWFGRAIGGVINLLDPDAVILGGGMGQIDGLPERFASAALPWVFNPEIRTEFLVPELGDSAGVFGAAMLAS